MLCELGISCVEDLLAYFPQTYLDYTHIDACRDLADGDDATVQVTVAAPTIFYRNGLSIVTARAADDTGKVSLRWYNQPYRLRSLTEGMQILAKGRVNCKRGVSILNPIIRQGGAGIEPVYAIKKGLTQRMMRDAVAAALDCGVIDELLPDAMRERFDLLSKIDAVTTLHRPSSSEMLAQAQRRMAFERALLYFLAVSEQRERRLRAQGFAFQTAGVRDMLQNKLRFPLTYAQRRVMDEVANDMSRPEPMNRLIQGDVGSGKTMVAFFALLVAARNGKQGAFLVPTEILARQHADTLQRELDVSCCVLLGGMGAAERKEALLRIADGSASIVIGTHALLQEKVRFSDLGVVVTDEQHRFGVAQRAAILDKGVHADTLVMSATPIPRTLSLLLYSDLDLSVIDQMPPGRKPIQTHLIGYAKRADLYRHLAREADAGRQSYVVCPLIEASEGMEGLSVQEISAEIGALAPQTRLGVLHGRMMEKEKRSVMSLFAAGKIDILVATTVIEVGVDVRNAANMVIEGADRFGLATLHQLRGRVGRGSEQAHCYLVPDQTGGQVLERLRILLETTDGFAIAERDLQLRGAGDLLGVRQHGQSDITSFLDAADAAHILGQAADAARMVLQYPDTANNQILDNARAAYGPDRHIAMN